MWIGDIEILPVTDGTFRLDGGAMFGTVPKVLWERRAPADDHNRIGMALNAIVIRTGGLCILVDAGIGDKLSAKEREIYVVDQSTNLDQSLTAQGITPDDVDLVIATHLHWDHAGGFTTTRQGAVVPRFPRARYVVRRGEWHDATHTHERNRASYAAEAFLPLEQAGVVEFIDQDAEVAPGVSVWRTGGHTAHHQIVRVDSGGQTALFLADMVPTSAHIDDPWVMGYDLYPVDALAAKKRWIPEAISGEYVIFFEHDPVIRAGVIRVESGKRRVEPLAV